MMKTICVLGATGSIGRQTLDVVSRMEGVSVAALTAGTNVEEMARLCRRFRPRLAVMADRASMDQLAALLDDPAVRLSWGEAGLMEAATLDGVDCVITAVVGMLGLKPTLAAIRAGKRIGLANKETLVCAGKLVMTEAKKYGAQIIPVDSEHSAIFQCLMGSRDPSEVKRIILTCSGGPFFGRSREQLRTVTKQDVLRHPTWKMGPKITVDCATLMNKGLEVIEAMHLYDLPAQQVDVVIHRQSIIHSMVEFIDGAVMAQMGVPDMRLPIQLALTYPQRTPCPVEPLDLLTCGDLTFHKPDTRAFPCLGLALDCARKGGNLCAAMNGANEEAVGLYLQDRIGFYDIYDLVLGAVNAAEFVAEPTLEQILATDLAAREYVRGHYQ